MVISKSADISSYPATQQTDLLAAGDREMGVASYWQKLNTVMHVNINMHLFVNIQSNFVFDHAKNDNLIWKVFKLLYMLACNNMIKMPFFSFRNARNLDTLLIVTCMMTVYQICTNVVGLCIWTFNKLYSKHV